MKKVWSDNAWEDYLHWQKEDRSTLKKVNDLIRDTERHPFSGLGKPEPLKEALSGWWSKRITSEHRLVYRVTGTGKDQALEILACRYHY
ncbi:Txe/YoeB family addiction module toxin [Azospirillum sp. B2RO_4]|uniref:Txe/YoeB family addiction module toxin n=1 Tax=Azospirillum sp. B2RO_4 TaxID=3027796 RepID=UPI003DA99C41